MNEHKAKLLLTQSRGNGTIHDVKSLVQFVFDHWVTEKILWDQALPSQIPFCDLFIVRVVTKPGTQHLQRETTNTYLVLKNIMFGSHPRYKVLYFNCVLTFWMT